VRDGLRVVEQLAEDLRIVGEAGTLESAWTRVQAMLPDVVLLDLRLPDGDGLDLCRRCKARYPNIRILCLTSYADAGLVLAAMEAGVDGYLLKHSDGLRIVQVVRDVMAGKPVFDPALGAESDDATNPLSALSPGELRVLAQVSRGLTDKEVSTALNLSVKTVALPGPGLQQTRHAHPHPGGHGLRRSPLPQPHRPGRGERHGAGRVTAAMVAASAPGLRALPDGLHEMEMRPAPDWV